MPKTSLHSLLQALERTGYVQRSGRGYALGGASYRLAGTVGSRDDLGTAAHHALEQLAKATRETTLLGCFSEDGKCVLYVDRIASTQPVRFIPELREPRPLHCTALGKVMLAWAEPRVVRDALRVERLHRFTDGTVRTKSTFLAELEMVRGAGYARSLDEMVEGGGALAAPVLEASGAVACALVIAAPTHRIVPNEPAWARLLRQHAAEIVAVSTVKGARSALEDRR